VEALFLLLAEFLFAPFIAMLFVVLEAVLALVGLGGELAFTFASNRSDPSGSKRTSRSRPQKLRRGTRILWKVSAALLLLMSLAVILLDTVFFPSSIGWILNRAEQKTGITATFKQVQGSFLSGKIQFDELRLSRNEQVSSDFDLSIGHASVNLSLLGLLNSVTKIQEVSLTGVSGSVTRYAAPKKFVPRKHFEIETLSVRDVDLTVTNRSPGKAPFTTSIEITSFESAPLRSRLAAFDVLFRSNLTASIHGFPVKITTEVIDDGRTTKWLVEEIPLKEVASYLPAPFSWIQAGTGKIDVFDSWELGKETIVHMKWNVSLDNVLVEIPNDLPRAKRYALLPVVSMLNKVDHIPLKFELNLDEEGFSGQASIETLGLWKIVADKLVSSVSALSGASKEAVGTFGKEKLKKFEDFVKRRNRQE